MIFTNDTWWQIILGTILHNRLNRCSSRRSDFGYPRDGPSPDIDVSGDMACIPISDRIIQSGDPGSTTCILIRVIEWDGDQFPEKRVWHNDPAGIGKDWWDQRIRILGDCRTIDDSRANRIGNHTST